MDLVWNVWETSRGRHLTDMSVHTIVAPHCVRISGRDQHKENSMINGDYQLVNIVEGKAAYRKINSDDQHVLRYWPAEDRWIIDLEAGFDGGDIANAYADANGATHPGNSDLLWYIWETQQGRHIPDDDVIAQALYLRPPDRSKQAAAPHAAPADDDGIFGR